MEVTKSINFCLYLIVLQIHIFEGDRKIFHHFGKLLKSCTKRDILEIRVLFHANCAAGLLEGKVTKPLCFQIYHKLRQDFRLTRSKKVPALARSSRADLFPGKTLWPLHPPHQLRPRCGTRNRNSAEKFQHSTTQNFSILACFLAAKGYPGFLRAWPLVFLTETNL